MLVVKRGMVVLDNAYDGSNFHTRLFYDGLVITILT